MAFLKIDTSGMNARYGRSAPVQKSQQVTSFDTPSKNRAPDIPKTEAKEGDILSFFDDGKGKILTSFDGGYQSAMTSKVSDMSRVDLGFDPISIAASRRSRIEFKGAVQAGLVKQNIVTITSDNKAQYISGKALYLDGTLGGEVGTFARAEVACEINEIVINDRGVYDASIVILESGGANWTFEFGTSSAQNNDLVMDSDDLFYAELSSSDMTITTGARALFTRSSNDWKLHSLSSLDGIIMQTGTLQPIADDTYDLGASTKEWKDLYVDGTANLDVVDIDGAVDMASTLTLAGNADFNGDLDVDGTISCDAFSSTGTTTLGDGTGDAINVNGRFGTSLIPAADDNHDLGSSSLAWQDLFLEGDLEFTDASSIKCPNMLTLDASTASSGGIALKSGTDMNFHSGNNDDIANDYIYFTYDSFRPNKDNTIELGGSTAAWSNIYYEGSISDTSDIRFKKNVDDSNLGLSFINDLRSVRYNHKTDDDADKKKYGLIAQEVQEALDIAGVDDFSGVHDENKDHLRIDYTQFIAPLIRAVQELSKEMKEMKNNET